jgi:CelD/BcsL family acetyltransferase involved in cellulose biosynthesis
VAITTTVSTRLLEGFDDPGFGPDQWEQLVAAGGGELATLSWHWQRTWWESCGRGELLLVLAERDGRPVALAPFYSHDGLVSILGSGMTDYVDFAGDVGDPQVIDALLDTAAGQAEGFEGFSFYYVPGASRTGPALTEAAERLDLGWSVEHEMPAPVIDIAGSPELALAATRKKSLVRHENLLRREGSLAVAHLTDGEQILPHLDELFEQHIARWAATPHPSRYRDPAERAIVEKATRDCAHTGWLRFTRLDWNGRPAAFHYGSCYRGRYYFGTTAYAIDLARHSPGEVLLRHLLLGAIEEGAHTFDFGLGDEAFKLRFATDVTVARAYGLYSRMDR